MKKDLEILTRAFPKELRKEIMDIYNIISFNTDLYNGGEFEIRIENQSIFITERIYYDEPQKEAEEKLSEIQKQILDCFFTRHHDGCVRQERIRNILSRGTVERWIIPFIMRIIGEYVSVILNDIYQNISLIKEDDLKEFIKENPKFVITTKSRIDSYWGEYFKTDIKKEEYVGFKIKKYIEKLESDI